MDEYLIAPIRLRNQELRDEARRYRVARSCGTRRSWWDRLTHQPPRHPADAVRPCCA